VNSYQVAPPRDRAFKYDFDAKYAAHAAKLLQAAPPASQGDRAESLREPEGGSLLSGLQASLQGTAAGVASTGVSAIKGLFKLTAAGASTLLGTILPDEILDEVEKSQSSATAFFTSKLSSPEDAAKAAAAMEAAMEAYRCSAAMVVINEFVKRWRARRNSNSQALSCGNPESKTPAEGAVEKRRAVGWPRRLPFAVSLRPLLECLSDSAESSDGDGDTDLHQDREMQPILSNPL
jgi:hypothetical protein